MRTNRLARCHHLDEDIEEIGRIVRSWARFRVVLHAEDRLGCVAKARERAVVEMDVRWLATCGAQARFVDAEAVVLAGDFNAASEEISHWLVRTAMTKLQFPCRGTKGER